MNGGYFLGVATIPVLLLAAFLVQAGLGLLVRLGNHAVPSVLRLTKDSSAHQRARVASVFFAGQRTWLVAFGEIGVSVVIGQRDGARSEAYQALTPKITLNRKFQNPE
jgi:hypothetical protein